MNKFYFHQTNEQVVKLFEAYNLKEMIGVHEHMTKKKVTFHIVSLPLMEYRDGELQIVPFITQFTDTTRDFVFSIESIRGLAKHYDKYMADIISEEIKNLTTLSFKRETPKSKFYVPIADINSDLETVELYEYSFEKDEFTCK